MSAYIISVTMKGWYYMQTSYFLGANSKYGFYSLFNELYNPEDNWRLFIIKGGPGTGKSSLIKKIAAEAKNKNLSTEYIYCSSDPSSLDAVIIPEIKVSVADGTKPHTLEPIYPGVSEIIINLGDYWDTTKLINNKEKIIRTTNLNSYYHKKCVKYLKASSIIDKEISNEIANCFIKEKADRFIKRYSEKLTVTETDSNKIQNRFLSAITHKGISVHYSSIYELCDEILILKDNTSYISNYILKGITEQANYKNIDKIICLCPSDPDKTEHIIFPNIRKGIFTSNAYHPNFNDNYKTIRFNRFIEKESYNKIKNKISFYNKAKAELIGESEKCLERAKTTHDILESYYISAMDFNKISVITDNLIKDIFNN